jgi:hypothetical protein
MSADHDTPSTGWSAPRLVALGTAQSSQAGASTWVIESGNYFPLSVS